MAAVTVTPSSGVTHANTLIRVDITGATPTTKYRVKATASGQSTLLSHNFNPSSDGKHSWFNVMFPAAGSWTVALVTDADQNTNVATSAVTVS